MLFSAAARRDNLIGDKRSQMTAAAVKVGVEAFPITRLLERRSSRIISVGPRRPTAAEQML